MDRALAERLLTEMGVKEKSPDVVRLALDAARQLKHALTDASVDVEVPAAVAARRRSLSRARIRRPDRARSWSGRAWRAGARCATRGSRRTSSTG
jgi:hypothetical protein